MLVKVLVAVSNYLVNINEADDAGLVRQSNHPHHLLEARVPWHMRESTLVVT